MMKVLMCAIIMSLFLVTNIESVMGVPILIHKYDEINVFDACSYYEIKDFDTLQTFSNELLYTDSKTEVIGKINNEFWEYEYIESYIIQIPDKKVPYIVEECYQNNKTMKMVCKNVTYYTQTYRDEQHFKSLWLTSDALISDIYKLDDMRLKSTQAVRFCADIERVWSQEGFTIKVDIIPNFDGVIYDNYAWWDSSWLYRKLINITNNNATLVLEAGYTINITLDTTGDKFMDNGDDLRIIYTNGSGNYSLDRINLTDFNTATTQIHFMLQNNITPSDYNDTAYYLYYGNAVAGPPSAIWNNVYKYGNDGTTDDFIDDLSSTCSAAAIEGGIYKITVVDNYGTCGYTFTPEITTGVWLLTYDFSYAAETNQLYGFAMGDSTIPNDQEYGGMIGVSIYGIFFRVCSDEARACPTVAILAAWTTYTIEILVDMNHLTKDTGVDIWLTNVSGRFHIATSDTFGYDDGGTGEPMDDIILRAWGYGGRTFNLSYIMLRPFLFPEPSVILGAEESYTPPPPPPPPPPIPIHSFIVFKLISPDIPIIGVFLENLLFKSIILFMDRLTVTGDVDIGGNLNVSGNVTAENIFLPSFIFAHTNTTMPVASAGTWYNISFDEEIADPKLRINHTHNDDTNDTFTILDDGYYNIHYAMSFSDASPSPSSHIVMRVVENGMEIQGSLLEEDSTKQYSDFTISNGPITYLVTGDKLKFQFASDDTDVSLTSHRTNGDHHDLGVVKIIRIA